MLVRPDTQDVRLIGLYTGRVVALAGLVMVIPAVVGWLRGEPHDALGFVIGASLAVIIGQAAELALRTRAQLQGSHALAVVALSWLGVAFVGAVPLFLSGHYATFLDAYFDAMSGFATAGLAVINDLDHTSDAVNLWRHLMQFMGGQGLVLVALTIFGGAGLTGLYFGEGREERILPNVRNSARFIWRVALAWAVLGTGAFWITFWSLGLPPLKAGLQAVMMFMAAFDTGGFSPTSASLGFYQSAVAETIAAVLMLAGTLSFALHRVLLYRRSLKPLWRNTEVRFLAATLGILTALTLVGLGRFEVYPDTVEVVRRGGFQLLSAHTGTGFNTVSSPQLLTDWGTLAPAALVVAMALGGMAGSTTGGVKSLRVAVASKALVGDIRRTLSPAGAQVRTAYQATTGRTLLTADLARGAVVIIVLYLLLYGAGALVGLFYGYTLQQALFESTSAAAAVGLSVGVVGPDLETPLKVVYIAQMWIGRLEFLAVFVLLGYAWSLLRGRG
jgi:trk system potassium uptake protein TrkH